MFKKYILSYLEIIFIQWQLILNQEIIHILLSLKFCQIFIQIKWSKYGFNMIIEKQLKWQT